MNFDEQEWDLLVAVPRWVVAAASAAQQDLNYRTNHEIEAGFVETARGRELGNAFVADVAVETMRIFDARSIVGEADFHDREAGLARVLDQVAAAVAILGAKADPEDARAYRRWLLIITDVVIAAAKSKDFLGMGGQTVTANERDFRDRLALTLQR